MRALTFAVLISLPITALSQVPSQILGIEGLHEGVSMVQAGPYIVGSALAKGVVLNSKGDTVLRIDMGAITKDASVEIRSVLAKPKGGVFLIAHSVHREASPANVQDWYVLSFDSKMRREWIWKKSLTSTPDIVCGIGPTGGVLLAGYGGGRLVSIDTAGKLAWETSIPGKRKLLSIRSTPTEISVVSCDDPLARLKPKDGNTIVFASYSPKGIPGPATLVDSASTSLRAADEVGRKLFVHGEVHQGSRGKADPDMVYCFDLDSKKLDWKRTLDYHYSNVVGRADGSAALTTTAKPSKVEYVEPNGIVRWTKQT
ncbi:MAG: hypothetical protein ABL949_17370, partial [Fimbriimonadaceae bacterium]